MAIRERKGRANPWQGYWNNPLTRKHECMNFVTRKEAEKYESLLKHRLKFDRGSFAGEEGETQPALSFESLYLLCLKEKQFYRKGLLGQMDCIRPALKKFGARPSRISGRGPR